MTTLMYWSKGLKPQFGIKNRTYSGTFSWSLSSCCFKLYPIKWFQSLRWWVLGGWYVIHVNSYILISYGYDVLRMRMNHRFSLMNTTIRFAVDSEVQMIYASHRYLLCKTIRFWLTTDGFLGRSGRACELPHPSTQSSSCCRGWEGAAVSAHTSLPLSLSLSFSPEGRCCLSGNCKGGCRGTHLLLPSLVVRRSEGDGVRPLQIPEGSTKRRSRRRLRKERRWWKTAAAASKGGVGSGRRRRSDNGREPA